MNKEQNAALEAERVAFEAAYIDVRGCLSADVLVQLRRGDDYADTDGERLNIAWRVWQQARAQLAAPAGVLELLRRARSFVEDWDDDSQEWMDLCGDIDNALAAAPLTAPAPSCSVERPCIPCFSGDGECAEPASDVVQVPRNQIKRMADDLAYAIYNLADAKVEDLKHGVVESTCPTRTALIVERNLRALLSGGRV